MPGHIDMRSFLLLLALSCSLIAGAPVLARSDAETVQLKGYAVQAWADARLQPSTAQAMPLRLAVLRNDSVTSSETASPDADRDDAERDGVPVAVLDGLLAGQLQGSGRFALLDEAELDPAVLDTTASLHVRVLRYQPPYRRGDRSGFWQQTRSRWRSWVAEEPQSLAVTMEAVWQDPARGHQRRLLVHVDGDSCLRLKQAPVTASTPTPASFTSEYRLSSIGQASLAAMNRIVAWLDAMHGEEQQSLAVVAVRGNRLQLADPQHWLQGRQELTLYHRDSSARPIGQIRLAPGDGSVREAWPLTLAAGSIRPGDWVRISRPTAAPSIVPAANPPGSQCPPAANENAHTAAATAPDNRHTDGPLLPNRADDRHAG